MKQQRKNYKLIRNFRTLCRSYKDHELYSEKIIFIQWSSIEQKRDLSLIESLYEKTSSAINRSQNKISKTNHNMLKKSTISFLPKHIKKAKKKQQKPTQTTKEENCKPRKN